MFHYLFDHTNGQRIAISVHATPHYSIGGIHVNLLKPTNIQTFEQRELIFSDFICVILGEKLAFSSASIQTDEALHPRYFSQKWHALGDLRHKIQSQSQDQMHTMDAHHTATFQLWKHEDVRHKQKHSNKVISSLLYSMTLDASET